MSKKNKNKMPPPAPIFWKKVDENQVSYFIWPYPNAVLSTNFNLPAAACVIKRTVDKPIESRVIMHIVPPMDHLYQHCTTCVCT